MYHMHSKEFTFGEIVFKISFSRTRQPKLFYVSSSSTTSSISTATVCYIATSSGAVTCGKRRRRALIDNGLNDGTDEQIQPMK